MFSVIIPTYNRAEYLGEAIGSVFMQTYTDWELVVVDDGSTDNTEEVVYTWMGGLPTLRKKEIDTYLQTEWTREGGELLCSFQVYYAENIERVKGLIPTHSMKFIQLEHEGCAGATKAGIENASGEWVTILDSDDILFPNSLKVIEEGVRGQSALGYIWTRFQCGNNIIGTPLPPKMKLKEALLSEWWAGMAQRTINRKIYLEQTPGLDPKLPYVVDQQLAALMSDTGAPTKHIQVVTYWCRQHSGRMSNTKRLGQHHCRWVVLERLNGGMSPDLNRRRLAEAKRWGHPDTRAREFEFK